MAYASGIKLSSLAGLIGAGVGGYLGYNYAGAPGVESITPVQGALILGGVGLVVGSAGAFILRSLMQFLIYIVLMGILAYFFRDQIEAMTGVDPVTALLSVLDRFGIPVPGFVEDAAAPSDG
ncbi:MAG: hypothetical protein AAFY43_06705 [Pseudomonadota bacterium]